MATGDRLLICDRARKWSAAVERFFAPPGVQVIRTPLLSPNCNAYAERFVRSIREKGLNRVIPLGERPFGGRWPNSWRITAANDQGLDNELIDRPPPRTVGGPARRRERIGGLLSYYCRRMRLGASSRTLRARLPGAVAAGDLFFWELAYPTRETLVNPSESCDLRRFSNQPVAEIVQCGEPFFSGPFRTHG